MEFFLKKSFFILHVFLLYFTLALKIIYSICMVSMLKQVKISTKNPDWREKEIEFALRGLKRQTDGASWR